MPPNCRESIAAWIGKKRLVSSLLVLFSRSYLVTLWLRRSSVSDYFLYSFHFTDMSLSIPGETVLIMDAVQNVQLLSSDAL